MRRLALFMLLSDKAKRKLMVLLDELKIEQPKTKQAVQILEKLPSKKGSALIALPKVDKDIILAVRNIPRLQTIQAKDLNCLDLASFKYLIMPRASLQVIKETFLKKPKS